MVSSDNMMSNTKSNERYIDERNTAGNRRKSMRVYLPLLLTTLICISAIPLIFGADEADAAVGEEFIVGGINYRVTAEGPPNTVEVIAKASLYTGDIVIPSSVTNASTSVIYEVTRIGNSAFRECSDLTSITIPNSVTSIGTSAFRECSDLTSVTIPNLVTSIRDYTFRGCSDLTSVTIPNSVTSIDIGAFYDCSSLASVTIPNSVTSIGIQAFYGCSSLTSVTIPNSVTSIEVSAFRECSDLTSVTIPNSVTSIKDYSFRGCSSLTSITIPNSVTSIGQGTFMSCSSLTSITIPNSVTRIRESAFNDCSSLTSITIPNSVTSIEDRTFRSCSSLTSITIPNSVTGIGVNAFYYCSSLQIVAVPDGLDISSAALSGRKIVRYAPNTGAPDIKFGVNAVIDGSDIVTLTYVSDRSDLVSFTSSDFSISPSNTFTWPSGDVNVIVDFTLNSECDVTVTENKGTRIILSDDNTVSGSPQTGLAHVGHDYVFSVSGVAGDILDVEIEINGATLTSGTEYTVSECMYTIIGANITTGAEITISATGAFDVTVYNTGIGTLMYSVNDGPPATFPSTGISMPWDDSIMLYLSGSPARTVSVWEWNGNKEISDDLTITNERRHVKVSEVPRFDVTSTEAPGTYITGEDSVLAGEDYRFTITSDPGVIFVVNVTVDGAGAFPLISAGNAFTIPMSRITGDILIETIPAHTAYIDVVGNGSVHYSRDGMTFLEYDPSAGNIAAGNGDNLVLKAIPSSENRFSGWKGPVPSGDEMNETITLIIDDDITITAMFSVISSSYNVYKQPGEGTDIIGNSKANKNVDYVFTVTRTEGYVGNPVITVTSSNYSVQYTGTGAYTIKGSNISGNIVIKTSDLIKEDEFITINVEGEGTVRYSTDNGNTFTTYQNPIHIADGVAIVLKAIPDNDNIFKEWRGITLSDGNSDTVAVNNTNKTVTAVFSSSDDDGSIIDGVDNIILIAAIIIVGMIVVGCLWVFVIRTH